MSDSADEDEATLPHEEFDGSSVGPDVPSIDVDDLDKSTRLEDVDADPQTAGLFWRLVLVFDVALFALVAGPALWYFDDRRTLGVRLTALGLIAFGYGVYKLRTRETGDGESTAGDEADDGTSADADHGEETGDRDEDTGSDARTDA